jgi:hypothetical protein
MINQGYNYNSTIPGSNSSPGQQGQGFPSTTLLGAFVSRLPYAYQILDSMMQRNPRFQDFKNVAPRREEIIQDQSVFLNDPDLAFQGGPGAPGAITLNKDYQAFIYANVDKDKTRRIQDYRRMAAFAELADCIDEICDECIVKDDNDSIIQFNLRGDYNKEVKDTVEKEYKKFIEVFDLEDKGWEYFRQFLIDGELYFENVILDDKKELGIVGLVSIPTELINPVYQNVQNEMVKGFLIRKPVVGPATSMNRKDQEELFFMNKAQVTYINSGIWNEFKSIRLPFIENAKRAYRQLSLVEDSIVIYRLVRAPERLRFTIYTGSMPPPKAEAYLKRLMQSYWTKKNFDSSQGSGGRVTNVYDPQSMLDAYWFTKDAQGNGSTVDTLPAGCLAMDTSVPLLDGRTLTISEIAKEYEAGKQNWIYSTDPATGKIVPGKVSWAGITQKSAQVMELIFDNNEKLICTPDHKFPILGKGFVEAKDLVIGESMIPFNTKQEKLGNSNYEMVYQNDTKTWEFTHRVVANYFKNTELEQSTVWCEKYKDHDKTTIHHKDYNRYNNAPENLVWMAGPDHARLHADNYQATLKPGMGTKAAKEKLQYLKEYCSEQYQTYCDEISKRSASMWAGLTEKEKQKRIAKQTQGIVNYINNLTSEEKEKRAKISRKNRYKGTLKANNTPELVAKRVQTNKDTWSKYKQTNDPVYLKRQELSKEMLLNRWQDNEYKQQRVEQQTIRFDKTIVDFVLALIKDKTTHVFTGEDVVNAINSNDTILQHFLKINESVIPRNWSKDKFAKTHLPLLAKAYGYTSWHHLRQETKYFNHKLIGSRYLETPIEVGTLTIDAKEVHHNYHTFALSCGIFTKNSNLGELNDLNYFLKKLYNSLKVPTSRFMSEDGGVFKDGAEITREELRFARFVMRIQRQFAMGIRDTFVAHLKMKGLWKQYKLRERAVQVEFNVPTSFMAMRDQQLLQMKFENFNVATQNESIAKSYSQKYYLQWSDEQMKENREWLRKDSAMLWELSQIQNMGPNWREQMAAQAGVAPEGGDMAGGAPELGGGGGGGGSEIPEFGGSSAAPTGPEAGAEAGAGGPGAEGGGGAPPDAGAPTLATGASTPAAPPA